MTREVLVQLSDNVRTIIRGDGTLPDTLYDLLVTPTPHGHEVNIHKYLPFLQEGWEGPTPVRDEVGNIYLDIGLPRKDFRTVFSCHLDTVHTTHDAKLGLMLTLPEPGKPETGGMVYAYSTYKNKDQQDMISPSILGADDKLGVYIMLKLIENKVPGRYIFHVGEERGGIGSSHIATKTPEVLKGMRRAIAFDRMNYTDTISFQSGGRCCSTEFSTALANELNKHLSTRHMQYKPDVRGVWTDTANYVKLVSECTNISVGYFRQHTTQEHFDAVWYLDILLPAILKVDWESLPTIRDKTKEEVNEYVNSYMYNRQQGSGDYTYSHGEVKMCDLEPTTPLYKIPKWHPITGIPAELNPAALVRLAEGYVNGSHYKHREIAITIAALVKSLDTANRSAREMRRYIAKNGGPVFKETSIKMNSMRRLLNSYDVAKQERKDRIDTSLLGKMPIIDMLAKIDDHIVDFNTLDELVTENFLRAEEYQEEINTLMEDIAIAMYPVHASTPNVKACYRNLVKVIKDRSTEKGFSRLFRQNEAAN